MDQLMNPRDALRMLDQVGAQFQGSRQDHMNIQQAVTSLRVFIEQHDPLDRTNNAETVSHFEEKVNQKIISSI